MTTLLLAVFTVADLALDLYLVRYSGGAEKKRPKVVLIVGVLLLLLLAAGYLLAVEVRLHSRPVVVHERQPGGTTAQTQAVGSGS